MIIQAHELQSVSFYARNIPAIVVESQRAVFRSLGLDHEQILTDRPHGEAIDEFLRTRPWHNLVLFDIDCVPLTLRFAHYFDPDGVAGGAQRAEHLQSDIYVSPAWMMLSRSTWLALGCPSFVETSRSDVGGEITIRATERGIPLTLVWPTAVVEPRWRLTDRVWFGRGTTWGGAVYHQFEIRNDDAGRLEFVERCRAICRAPGPVSGTTAPPVRSRPHWSGRRRWWSRGGG